MKWDSIPEERQSPELVEELQQFYDISAENQASLARIKQRFSQVTSTMPLHVPDASMDQPGHITPFSGGRLRNKPKRWPYYLNLVAALLVIAVITSATLAVFQLTGKHQLAGEKQATPTVVPTIIPTGHSTIIGEGINLGSFYMVTEQIGWSLPGKKDPYGVTLHNTGPLFRTTDGAKTWQQIELPDDLETQTFSASVLTKDALLLQPTKVSTEVSTGGHIIHMSLYYYRTLNAGKTWEKLRWPTTPNVAKDGFGFFDCSFLDEQHGWVMIRQAQSGLHDPPPSTEKMLFKTADGGKTWQNVVTHPMINNVYFSDPQTAWESVYTDGTGDQPSEAKLFVTHDGGENWEAVKLPLPKATLQRIEDLHFVNATQGYFVGQFTPVPTSLYDVKFVYVTVDGGKTWQILGDDLPIGIEPRMIDSTHVYSHQNVYTLTNGRWVPNATFSLNVTTGVEFLTPQVGFASVMDGSIYKTEDGGQTWKKIAGQPQ